jgi:hypothetical protein
VLTRLRARAYPPGRLRPSSLTPGCRPRRGNLYVARPYGPDIAAATIELTIIAIAAAMGALFAAAYSLAPGRATPHHITVGLVGSRAQAVWLACALAALLISARLLRRRPTGR